MNSVSMPRRPPARAAAASSETTSGETVVATVSGTLSGRLVGPVPVLVEVAAGGLLVVALAVAADADAEQDVDHPDRQAGADDARRALERPVGPDDDERDHAAEDDDRGQPVADELQPRHAAILSGVKACRAAPRSPGRPTERSSRARTSLDGASCSASVTAPCRLASRAPSGPSTSGTWA